MFKLGLQVANTQASMFLLNEIILVTLEKEVERVFNFTTITQMVFNYVFILVEMET